MLCKGFVLTLCSGEIDFSIFRLLFYYFFYDRFLRVFVFYDVGFYKVVYRVIIFVFC